MRNGLLAGIAIPVLIEAVGPRVARQLHDAWRHVRCRDGAAHRPGRSGRRGRRARRHGGDPGRRAEARRAVGPDHWSKKLITEIDALPHDTDAADILGEHVANQCVTDEALEGMSAFLDKRKPKWAA